MSRLTRAEWKAFSRIGAFVMSTARKSVRKRKRASAPGNPPHRHTDTKHSVSFVTFKYDKRMHGVLVGPEKFKAKGYDVPHITEFGGKSIVANHSRSGKITLKRAKYPPRPFMGPALEKNAHELPKFMGGTVSS